VPQVELELALDDADDPEALRARVARRLGVPTDALGRVRLLRRALDCRKGRVRFHLTLDIPDETDSDAPGTGPATPLAEPQPKAVTLPARVIVVGDGPAGLFCAYQLARRGIASVVLDRGKPVQPRRRDLKGLNQRGQVDPNSNYCFGEGGAGTYSDGKLYTRSHKRGDVRDVIEILALHGAPEAILTEARPHIGSNRLPKVVSALRERLESVGVEFRFESRVIEVLRRQDRVTGVRLEGGEELGAECVVLATGHSARDVYRMLAAAGHPLEAKAFALGVRIEHPQKLINAIQYGKAAGHPKLPSAAYSVVDSRAQKQGGRAVFSFCMCPGGFIVPAMTEPGEIVVNGMSLSRRDSPFANSGLVMSVEPEDVTRAGFDGPLAGIEMQRAFERAAFERGSPMLEAPATRVVDFLEKRASTDVPATSYIPGLVPCDIANVLDATRLPLAEQLRTSLRHIGRQLKGYLDQDAVLVGVESRTSSPLRIPRTDALASPVWEGLYPAGEGAGYAGGIVSAAVDGIRVANAIAERIG
jgi:uncharacterized FAD-dependent dehydrogenase